MSNFSELPGLPGQTVSRTSYEVRLSTGLSSYWLSDVVWAQLPWELVAGIKESPTQPMVNE